MNFQRIFIAATAFFTTLAACGNAADYEGPRGSEFTAPLKQRVFPVIVNRKMGFINHAGELVIPAAYEMTKTHDFWEWRPRSAKLIMAEVSDDYLWDENQHLIESPVFFNGFCPVVKDGHAGFVRQDGGLIIEPRYREVGAFIDGLAWGVDEDGSNHLMRDDGKIVARGFEDSKRFREGLVPLRVDGKWGYADIDGTFVIPPKYKDASCFKRGQAEVEEFSGEKISIDRTGNRCNSERLEYRLDLELVSVQDKASGKWGYSTFAGRMIIPQRFDRVWSFQNGLAPVAVGSKWGYIDCGGDYVVEPTYDDATPFAEGIALVARRRKRDGRLLWGIVNRLGAEVVPPKYYSITREPSPNAFDAVYGTPESLPVGLVLARNQDDEMLLIDLEGNPIFDRTYKQLQLAGRGQLITTTDEGCGLIDLHGRVIAPPIYYFVAEDIKDGLRAVGLRDHGFGFLDEQGNVVIKPQYDYADDFKSGLCRVAVGIWATRNQKVFGGKWGYIDTSGNWVWKPTN